MKSCLTYSWVPLLVFLHVGGALPSSRSASWINVLEGASPSSRAASWNYVNQNWASLDTAYAACDGSSQSPIYIDENAAAAGPIAAITFDNYDSKGTSSKIENDGHTVKITPTFAPGAEATISDGGLTGTYRLAQYHLHWGNLINEGSEHRFGANKLECLFNPDCYTPVELHLVHYSTTYPDLGAAANQPQGLAVLGIMYKVQGGDNSALTALINSLSSIKQADAEITGPSTLPNFEDLLPTDRTRFFRYPGSLTTPPCFESVVWTVFREIQTISNRQWSKLKTRLRFSDRTVMTDNFRDPQPLGSRTVQKSW